MNQSIMGKALLKGTLMALTNACIIWLILYIANMDKSVLMVVAVVVAAAFGYVTAYFEARAALNAQEAQARHARGGDVSSSSDGVDTSDSSREEDDEDDFVDPYPTRTRATSTPEAPAAPAVRITAATAAPTTLAAAIPVEATLAVAATKL